VKRTLNAGIVQASGYPVGSGDAGTRTQDFLYIPPLNFKGTVSINYKGTNTSSTSGSASFTKVLTIDINANLQPVITAQAGASASPDINGVVRPITSVMIMDDATSSQILTLTVTITAIKGTGTVSLVDTTMVKDTYVQMKGGFTVNATLGVLNSVLGTGNGLNYTPGVPGGGTMTIYVNDNGAGLVPADPTRAQHASLNIMLSDPPIVGTISSAGALIGVTSMMSMSTYGVYKVMKKRKLIPEDAAPWESDGAWDATTDNPLFSGPVMEAVFEN